MAIKTEDCEESVHLFHLAFIAVRHISLAVGA
jgi:hypothetical protein